MRISNGGGMAVQKAVADKWIRITACRSSRVTAVGDLAGRDL